ncbi:MAG: enoyl-CoA hydratase/isomerase family protein [Rhodospirillaceae bacterium]|nr:enoyl-CoA hydratase/isomerase family protein [Rhodospirillaceae bacterium]
MSEANHIVAKESGIARIVLNRPAVHNALDDRLIVDLTTSLDGIAADLAVRIVLLTGQGTSFCAGGDLNWMRRTAEYTHEQNFADALNLARLLQTLNTMPQPTVALVNGPAYGGGVGVVACCDIAIAAEAAKFSLSEVRLGLLPATISPYVIRKIGEGNARRYFLTAEVFEAADAKRLGLVHEVVPAAELAEATGWFLKRLLEGGPHAQAASKQLVAHVAGAPIDEALMADTAQRIADRRASAEGKEGVDAFLAKRQPSWRG